MTFPTRLLSLVKERSMSQSVTTTGIAAHIAVIDGQPTTTTQDIADVYGKRHDHVLRIVRQRMAEAPEEWRLPNFGEASIERPQTGGGTVAYPVIRMTKKGFHFVVGKFTGTKAVQHQIAFADAFERMEADLSERSLGHTVVGEPVFHVTAKELDELVEQRVQQHWLGKVALDALPKKRLQAERDALNALLTDAGQLALVADMFIKASQNLAGHALLAGEVIGGVTTLRARAHAERDRVDAEMGQLTLGVNAHHQLPARA
jgi:Rha family phage regulatory protein